MNRVEVSSGLLKPPDAYTDKRQDKIRPGITLLVWSIGSCLLVALSALGLRGLERAFTVPFAEAATVSSPFRASIVSVTEPSTLKTGQTATIVVTVKNIGTTTWLNSGKNYVSIYRYDPIRKVETTSLFSTPSWSSDQRPTVLPTASLKPGQWANFYIPIKAPSIPGNYHEDFIVVAENLIRMSEGKFSLDVTVTGSAPAAAMPPVTAPASLAVAPAPATPAPVSASGWGAALSDKGGTEWQIEMQDHAIVELAFTNTGTKTWTRDGANYVSLYATDGTKERTSAFKDASWIGPTHPVKLKEKEVKPGQIGHFRLDLRAPSQPGMFKETFTLAAENSAWIPGSALTLPIRVPTNSEFIATAPPAPNEIITSVPASQAAGSSGSYLTQLLLRSANSLTLLGNGSQQLTFGFKNTGTAIWNTLSLRVKGVTPALSTKLSSVRDDSWLNSAEPVRMSAATRPGEIGLLTFKIKAPPKKGSYTASFSLVANEQAVDGGVLDIPITVTADGYIEPDPVPVKTPTTGNTPSTTPPASAIPSINAIPLTGDPSSLPNEPIIRVGLFKTTDNQMIIRATYAPLTVLQNGTTICHISTGQTVTASYDRTNKVYKLSGGSCTGQSTNVYLFRADDGISPIEVTDFSHTLSWLPGANDNKFRSQLELRYTPSSDSVWVINELPIEWYLKGIGETSNSSPQEYQRALLTAARTYAMYHVQHATKHASENYLVDATYDQVYRGYGAEARDPNVVAAVDATRGQIVTYNGTLALTPYYSRSDGRTRSWTEVWGGGPYAWLVSVPVPWDQGKTLWGHGVGMSATGALGAAAEGWTYDRILKLFYQQTELRRAYK